MMFNKKKSKTSEESKTELFWSIVGDKIQSWFLNHGVLYKDTFDRITELARKEVY